MGQERIQTQPGNRTVQAQRCEALTQGQDTHGMLDERGGDWRGRFPGQPDEGLLAMGYLVSRGGVEAVGGIMPIRGSYPAQGQRTIRYGSFRL